MRVSAHSGAFNGNQSSACVRQLHNQLEVSAVTSWFTLHCIFREASLCLARSASLGPPLPSQRKSRNSNFHCQLSEQEEPSEEPGGGGRCVRAAFCRELARRLGEALPVGAQAAAHLLPHRGAHRTPAPAPSGRKAHAQLLRISQEHQQREL